MGKPFNWLLAGAGNIARIRVGAALRDAENSRLAAICDIDAERARALARQLDIEPAVYTDYPQALRESGADGVYIATQAGSHVPLGIQAVEAGKHFLCEKPLGVDVGDAGKLYDACRKAAVKTGCSDYRRLSEQYKTVERLVKNGAIGEFTGGWMNWVCCERSVGNTPLSRSVGGSPLKTLAFYIFDIVHNLFGMPSEATARCCTTFNPKTDTEDMTGILLTFPNGAVFSLNVFLTPFANRDEMEFYGTRGRITLRNWPPSGNGPVVVRLENEGEKEIPAFTNPNWHIPMIEDFIRAVREDREPVCTILSAFQTELITDAVFRSEKSGKSEPVGKAKEN